MSNVLKWGAVFASCAVMSFWSLPIASGSEVSASGPTGAANMAPARLLAAPAPTGFGLTISPTRLVIQPKDIGDTQKILVSNGSDSPESVTVEKRNFTSGADGALDFQDSAPYSASDWVTIDPPSFVLAAGATQTVTATIAVPPRPEPGDHQVALVFLVPAGATKANIKINRGIATPVYITVAGPTSDTAKLSHLKASGFAVGGPVTITAQVTDTGTVHRDFRGATPLKISASGSAAAFPDFTVLRGGTRDISTTWNPPLFCICHPTVSVVNGGGAVSSMTVQVIVVPLPLLGAIAAAALLLSAGFWLTRRGYRISVRNAAATMLRPVSSGGV